MNKMKEKRNAEVKAMEDILSSTDKTIEDMCHEAVLLYSKYAKSMGCTLTTENIKQIYDGISRIQGEKYEGIH